jgi:outer membrane protein TolC
MTFTLPCHGRSANLLLAAVLVLVPFCAAAPAVAANERPVINAGIVYDGPGSTGPAPTRSLRAMERVVEATVELTRREFDVRFPAELRRSGNWDLEQIRRVTDELLTDPAVDLVVTFGPIATVNVCRRTALPKPVIAAYAVDIQAQRLPTARDAKQRLVSGVPNLNYLTQPGSALRDLQRFSEIVYFTGVHVLVDSVLLESSGEIETIAGYVARQLDVETVLIPVSDSADEVFAALPPDAEAVYVTPLSRFSDDEFQRLVDGLAERRLPSFSLTGRDEVERGILAGVRPATNFERLARRIALNIQRVLLGEDAGTLPVLLEQQEELTINLATVRAIGLPVRWRTLVEAEVVHDVRVVEQVLTLDETVAEALAANPTLRAKRDEVAGGAEDIVQARSIYKPSVGASAGGVWIDEERAQVSLGTAAERTFDGTLSVTQLIYSDGASANVRIANELQSALERELESLRLETALATAIAFLDVLRSETLERIVRDNLRLTQSNLELARRRQEVGYSGPADVFRWESVLATSRSDMITAVQQTRALRYELNRLMNRPQRQEIGVDPPRLEDPRLLTGFGRLAPYLETVGAGDHFMEFLVLEGIERSPEIGALDASIVAQQRVLLATQRAYWAPEISASGEYRKIFSRSGEGSDPPPGIPDLDDNWSLGVFATLPIYTGGERASLRRQAADQLRQLRAEREALVQSIELRVRAAYTQTGSSFAAIGFAREAATASAKNLELVTDSYSQGVVSIIDLLDAQSAALSSDLSASNAEYDFLIDLMELQRAANSFGFLSSAEQRDQWFRRLEQFFIDSGVPLAGPAGGP